MSLHGTPGSARLAGRFARLFRRARARGAARTLYSAVQKLADRRFWPKGLQLSIVEVFRASVPGLKAFPRIPPSFTVRRAGSGDLESVQAFFGDPRRVRNRFQQGHLCVITLAKGEICAAVWLAPGPNRYHEDAEELGCVFRVPGGVAWSYDGKGVKFGAWGSLMAKLPALLGELGIGEIFTLIDCNNQKSVDGHKSLGYQSSGMIGRLRLFGFACSIFQARGGSWRRPPGRIGKLELCDAADRPACDAEGRAGLSTE